MRTRARSRGRRCSACPESLSPQCRSPLASCLRKQCLPCRRAVWLARSQKCSIDLHLASYCMRRPLCAAVMYGFACVCMCRSGGRRPCRLFFDVHGGSASVLQSCVCCRPGLGRHIRCQLFARLYTFGTTPYGSCAPARIAVDRSTSHVRRGHGHTRRPPPPTPHTAAAPRPNAIVRARARA